MANSSPLKIAQAITGFAVKSETAAHSTAPVTPPTNPIQQMHEKMERPAVLFGSTYKIKTPLSEHALYLTINDMVLNPGTPHEQRRPFEMFINSKSMEHFQWIVAVTRIISAIFRKGGDVAFLVDEMRSVFDPKGGYFKAGGQFMPSLVAEIGDVVDQHLRAIGLLKAADAVPTDALQNAMICPKCQHKTLVRMDGCETCLNCGYSKCG